MRDGGRETEGAGVVGGEDVVVEHLHAQHLSQPSLGPRSSLSALVKDRDAASPLVSPLVSCPLPQVCSDEAACLQALHYNFPPPRLSWRTADSCVNAAECEHGRQSFHDLFASAALGQFARTEMCKSACGCRRGGHHCWQRTRSAPCRRKDIFWFHTGVRVRCVV